MNKQPPWESEVIRVLDRLKDGASRKKRSAILAVVTARTSGISLTQLWASPDRPCSEGAYYRWMEEDPIFKEVLEEVERLAFAYMDRESLENLRAAKRSLATAARAAGDELFNLLASDDPKIRLAAANSILDRAALQMLDEADGGKRTVSVNSDTMAALVTEAMKQRGKMIDDAAQ